MVNIENNSRTEDENLKIKRRKEQENPLYEKLLLELKDHVGYYLSRRGIFSTNIYTGMHMFSSTPEEIVHTYGDELSRNFPDRQEKYPADQIGSFQWLVNRMESGRNRKSQIINLLGPLGS